MATKKQLLIRRLVDAMEKCGMSGRLVSKEAELSYGVVRDIISGKVDNPRTKTLERIAPVVGLTVAYLRGEVDDLPQGSVPIKTMLRPARRMSIRAVPVIGVAEPGSFRVDPIDWQSETKIDVVPHKLLPDARHFALLMAENTAGFMNAVSPTFALCVQTDLPVMNGETYAIQRGSNDGWEVCIRRAHFLTNEVELTSIVDCAKSIRVLKAARKDFEPGTSRMPSLVVLGLAYTLMSPLSRHAI